MRIAFVTPRYPPEVGGVEKHVERLARHAVGRGHDAIVITHGRDGVPAHAEEEGVEIRRFPLLFASAHYAYSPSLGRFLRDNLAHYDVVHAHNYHALPAATAAMCHPRAFVFTPHYHGTSASSVRRALHRPYKRIGAQILRQSARVICVSEREAGLVRSDFPWAAPRIEVIRNGVDARAIASAEPFPASERVILSAGRLEHYKSVDRLIQAMVHLDAGYVLKITGEGPARGALEEQVDAHALRDRVEFVGKVSLRDLYRWFRTASVYVTMSRIEAMPLTPLEVLAAGKPVVASDIAAHREIAESTGGAVDLVAPDVSPPALASAIERAAVRGDGQASVLDWAQVGERTLEVYGDALARAGSHSR